MQFDSIGETTIIKKATLQNTASFFMLLSAVVEHGSILRSRAIQSPQSIWFANPSLTAEPEVQSDWRC
jgi:hypothetical protein